MAYAIEMRTLFVYFNSEYQRDIGALRCFVAWLPYIMLRRLQIWNGLVANLLGSQEQSGIHMSIALLYVLFDFLCMLIAALAENNMWSGVTCVVEHTKHRALFFGFYDKWNLLLSNFVHIEQSVTHVDLTIFTTGRCLAEFDNHYVL